MDVVLLHNKNAGDGKWSRKALLKLVKRAGFRPTYCELNEALEDPAQMDAGEFVIVAGGDGAVRSVALASLGRGRALAPLPLGTANNILRSFNLPPEPEEIVDGWRHARHRPFDVGLAAGPWGKRHFIEGVGIGLIGRSIGVIEDIDEVAVYEYKKARHKLHRDICVTAALAHEMKPITAKVSFDNRHFPDDYLLLEILNIRRAGPGVELAPHASPSDGRFDIVSVTARQRGRLLYALKSSLAETERLSGLNTRRAQRVSLRLHSRCDIRIDDTTIDIPADTTVKITLKPGALQFVLPG